MLLETYVCVAETKLNTLLRLAAVSELQDRAYDSAEVQPKARRPARNVKLVLAQHLQKILTSNKKL